MLFVYSGNHHGIARDTGFANIKEYRYYNPDTKGLDIEGMIADLTVTIYSYCMCIYIYHQYIYYRVPQRIVWLYYTHVLIILLVLILIEISG